jgi:hypothetical protein
MTDPFAVGTNKTSPAKFKQLRGLEGVVIMLGLL